jgi:hypothetical protein
MILVMIFVFWLPCTYLFFVMSLLYFHALTSSVYCLLCHVLQAKNVKAPGSLSGWPTNATKLVLNLLENAEANAESKNLDLSKVVVQHAQANAARKGGRRTYRAHGRINPYMRVPSHVELILVEESEPVAKPKVVAVPKQFKVKLAARKRGIKVPVGGGN